MASFKGCSDFEVTCEDISIQVFYEMDIKQVIEKAPWTFNSHLLIIHWLEDNEDPMQIPLVFSPYWVQAFDLLPGEVDKIGSSNGLGQTMMEHDLEEYPIEYVDGKKRLRVVFSDSNILGIEDSLGAMDKQSNVYPNQILTAVRRLRDPLKIYNPQIIFLIETKLNSIRMKQVRKRWGFNNRIDVQADGTRRGLSILDIGRKVRNYFELLEEIKNYHEKCQLADARYSRSLYTWKRGNLLEISIHERLDSGQRGIKEKCVTSSRRLHNELERLTDPNRGDEILAEIIDVKLHLNLKIDKEEAYWEQRARAIWLKLGDRNTVFSQFCIPKKTYKQYPKTDK
ncbi:hypothetical protein Godav_002716 [Gossypium davidsonii]|uniref:DUF4283 domain-containing protein n=1 Tax=Gossypium davidsonii TaxID=34287 RepID=A0A7J8SX01_GOSDV|nr:hypothetical protein [Gossypium davidsonii]